MIKYMLILLLTSSLLADKTDKINVLYSNVSKPVQVKVIQECLGTFYVDSINYIILKENKYFLSNKNNCLSIIPASNCIQIQEYKNE